MTFKEISKQRTLWMGFAMLWVVFYHFPCSFGIPGLQQLKAIGYGGVDIFLFASGLGCYYSLLKNNDIGYFIKRRITKIARTYIPFICVWIVCFLLLGQMNFRAVVGNIFGVQYIADTGKSFNWYITGLLILYLAAPYFKSVIDKGSRFQNCLFFLMLIALSVPFWNNRLLIIIVTRLPVFCLGMLFAKRCESNDKATKKIWIIICFRLLIGLAALLVGFVCFSDYLWTYGLYWYPFILVAPSLCFLISWFFNKTEHLKIVSIPKKILSFCGKNSFEIYLLHIFIFEICGKIINKFNLDSRAAVIYALSLLVLAVGIFVLKFTVKTLSALREKFIIKS